MANHLLLFSGPRPAKGPAPGELLVAGQDDWRQTVNRLPTRVLAVPEEALAAALDASPADTTSALTLRPEQRPTSLASSAPVEPTALGFPAIGSSLEANSFENQTFCGRGLQPGRSGPGLHRLPGHQPPAGLLRKACAPESARCGTAPRRPESAPGGAAVGGPGL